MKPITRDQAIHINEREIWKKWTSEWRALFQLQQRPLCMPFDELHKAVEVLLKRPVWTHESVDPKALIAEFADKTQASFPDVLDKLPKDKEVVVVQT